jgi:hypothetical protein
VDITYLHKKKLKKSRGDNSISKLIINHLDKEEKEKEIET